MWNVISVLSVACVCVSVGGCVRVHVYSATASSCPSAYNCHHGGGPSLCEGQRHSVSPMRDSSDL